MQLEWTKAPGSDVIGHWGANKSSISEALDSRTCTAHTNPTVTRMHIRPGIPRSVKKEVGVSYGSSIRSSFENVHSFNGLFNLMKVVLHDVYKDTCAVRLFRMHIFVCMTVRHVTAIELADNSRQSIDYS